MGSGGSKPNSGNVSLGTYSAELSTEFNIASYSVSPTPYKKKALVIGINYTNTNINELRGCINDSINVKKLLDSYGYEVTLMNDLQQGSLYPTRANILSQINQHISALASGDTFILYYSGHGTRVTDINGDEISGLDSVIVPIDANSQGFIVDDTIRSAFNSAVSGSKIFAFFDACNSGSLCDLRYNYFDTSYRSNPADKLSDNLVTRTPEIVNNKYVDTQPSIISLSGCRDDQLSVETVSDRGIYIGALTYSILKYIYEQTPNNSVASFLQYVRNLLSSNGFSQKPSLMSGKSIDPSGLTLAQYFNI
jgi:hypothetical protein